MLGTKSSNAPSINHYHQLITGLANVDDEIFTAMNYALHYVTLLCKITITMKIFKKYADVEYKNRCQCY